MLLIQAFVPESTTEKEQKKLSADSREVDGYIEDLKRTNPKLADLMRQLWSSTKNNPEQYRDQQIATVLEDMKQTVKNEKVANVSEKWALEEEQLAFVVDNYNPKKEKQNGEAELKHTSNYKVYKANTEEPVSRLTYWKEAKQAVTDMVQEEILPLRRE